MMRCAPKYWVWIKTPIWEADCIKGKLTADKRAEISAKFLTWTIATPTTATKPINTIAISAAIFWLIDKRLAK